MKCPLILPLLLLSTVCAFGAEPLRLVKKYEELAAHGLKASLLRHDGTVAGIRVNAVDPQKKLPAWMQALYLASRDGEARDVLYEFDMARPNRVQAFFGWSETQRGSLIIIGPVLPGRESFKDGSYLAIPADDLITWLEDEKKKPAEPVK